MKRIVCALCIVMLLVSSLGAWPVAAAGSMSASANTSSVTVGSSVTVTVKYDGSGASIGGLQSVITYNAEAFEYVSCSGIEANGGSGTLRLVWYATGASAPTSVTYTVVFKAKAVGDGNITVSTSEFIDDNTYASLGSPSQTLSVAATNPTMSGNANLKSLKPSTGTLTPAFNANTTAYTVKVPYTTTSLSLSAIAAQNGAKVSVSGSNTLKVGSNTQIVTVTAPNGTTKKYTVTITRLNEQEGDGQTSSTAPIADDALEVEVNGATLTVSDSQPDAELPSGYEWDSTELNGITVSAAKNKENGLTLLYLLGDTAEENAFYIYENGEFTLFNPLTTDRTLYVLLPMPEGMDLPRGAAAGEITVGEKTIAAYIFEDTALADIALFYAIGPTGYTGLYVYDTTDGSIQRYREFANSIDTAVEPEETPTNHPIIQFILDHRTLILIGAAAVGAAGLLTIAIVLIVRACKRPGNCRH